MEKHWGNFKLLILQKLRRILKMKIGNIYFVQIFRHSERKFRDIFVLIFGKTCEKLFEKHEIILRKF